MSMNKREKRLGIIVGILALCFIGYMAFAGAVDPFSDLRRTRDGLDTAIDKAEKEALELTKARDRVKVWQKRSLPADAAIARSEYNQWLRTMAVTGAKLRNAKVEPGQAPQARKGVYTVHHFTVTGQGTPTQLTKFLQDFYATGYLHQIKNLKVKSDEKTKELDLTIIVEALTIEGAVEKEALPKDPVPSVVSKEPAAYKAIADRNLFAAYTPPPPPPGPKPPEPKPPIFDPSKYTRVTGIVEVNGKPQAWLRSLTDEKSFYLSSGENFKVGTFQCTIARIGPREIEIEVDGKRHVVPLGESVTGEKSSPIKPPPEPERKPDAKPEPKPEAAPEKTDARTEVTSRGPSDGRPDGRGKMDFRGKRGKRDRNEQEKKG